MASDKKRGTEEGRKKSNKNLIPLSKRTPEERREIARKGALAMHKVLDERKTIAEELKVILSEKDNQRKMSIAIFNRACKGDTKAFEIIRDTIGEKPLPQLLETKNIMKRIEIVDDLNE